MNNLDWTGECYEKTLIKISVNYKHGFEILFLNETIIYK